MVKLDFETVKDAMPRVCRCKVEEYRRWRILSGDKFYLSQGPLLAQLTESALAHITVTDRREYFSVSILIHLWISPISNNSSSSH